MFRRLPDARPAVRLTIDGEVVTAAAGDTVAAVLLVAGRDVLRRSAVSGAPRGVYCGMGVCFDCLVAIDGEPNRQACLTPVAEGMNVVTGQGAPAIASWTPGGVA